MKSMIVVCLSAMAALLSAGSASAAPGVSVYAPYEFLIGEWEIGEEGAPPAAVTRATWGPNGSYIWVATDLLMNGVQVPHYEGMFVWNGVRKDLDMLLTLDPVGAKVQEQGRLSVQPDGTIVRDVTAIYGGGAMGPDGRRVGAAGATFTFQQKYRLIAPGKIETSMLRKTDSGWVATFPGSESVVMVKKAGGNHVEQQSKAANPHQR